jgi:hypothetical protein
VSVELEEVVVAVISRRASEAPAVLHPPAGAIGLIGSVGAALDVEFLLEAALGFLQPRGA